MYTKKVKQDCEILVSGSGFCQFEICMARPLQLVHASATAHRFDWFGKEPTPCSFWLGVTGIPDKSSHQLTIPVSNSPIQPFTAALDSAGACSMPWSSANSGRKCVFNFELFVFLFFFFQLLVFGRFYHLRILGRLIPFIRILPPPLLVCRPLSFPQQAHSRHTTSSYPRPKHQARD